MLIAPITSNNNSFCGKKSAATILSLKEQKELVQYKHKFDYSENKQTGAVIKRTFDVIFSVIGLIATTPALIISSIAIRLDSKGPSLFKQERIGKDGKPFTIYKLRTMKTNSEDKLLQDPDDERITRVGKILRKYSIDEFPQFINIIKGDMSLVGPRPINQIAHNIGENDDDFFLRYAVKPGATLNYPNIKIDNIPNARISTEKDYIEHWSLKNDLKILINIVSKILKGENY